MKTHFRSLITPPLPLEKIPVNPHRLDAARIIRFHPPTEMKRLDEDLHPVVQRRNGRVRRPGVMPRNYRQSRERCDLKLLGAVRKFGLPDLSNLSKKTYRSGKRASTKL